MHFDTSTRLPPKVRAFICCRDGALRIATAGDILCRLFTEISVNADATAYTHDVVWLCLDRGRIRLYDRAKNDAIAILEANRHFTHWADAQVTRKFLSSRAPSGDGPEVEPPAVASGDAAGTEAASAFRKDVDAADIAARFGRASA